MFTKGFSLIETLLALALSSLIFTAALSCHWFARRSYQLALEQMTATHLLIDISHSVDVRRLPGQPPLGTAFVGCAGCDGMTLKSLHAAAELLQQPMIAHLRDVQLCAVQHQGAISISLSWRSVVTPVSLPAQACGGRDRRQVTLDVQ